MFTVDPLLVELQEAYVHLMTGRGAMTHEEAHEHFESITESYLEPHRYYHTLQHILDLYAQFKTMEFQDPDSVLLALLYHDIVYIDRSNSLNPEMSDEEESAYYFAHQAMEWAEFDQEFMDRVMDIIIATETHETLSSNPDIAKFIDMDMAILGSDPARYREYARQVAMEWLPIAEDKDNYLQGRLAFLRGQQNKTRLYITDDFQTRLGRQAKENIAWEIQNLRAVIQSVSERSEPPPRPGMPG